MSAKGDTLSVFKADARNKAFARRKEAKSERSDLEGARRLIDFLSDHHGQPTSGYMPIRTEIDPIPAMTEMNKFGPVGVPVIRGGGAPLTFQRWTPETPMKPGVFGALVPVHGEIVVPTVLIVPLLAFDARGHRLGYGGGFYDRTLQQLRSSGPVLAVGFAFAEQQIDQVPIEKTDQPLDVIVTQEAVMVLSA